MQRVRLPRSSSKVYRQLQLSDLIAGADATPAPGQQREPQEQPIKAGLDKHFVEKLLEFNSKAIGSLLDGQQRAAAATGGNAANGSIGSKFSQVISAAQSGQLSAADALHQLHLLCDVVISSCWLAGRKEEAQAASDLLDEANGLLEEFDHSAAATSTAGGSPAPIPAPALNVPKLPLDTFFLSLDRVKECLTINIDSSILVHSQQVLGQQQAARRGGWPLGRKRKAVSMGQAKRNSGKHYNPWTPELQQQLATVLLLTLGGTAPDTDGVALLPPVLANLAEHLHGSQAGEQLQAMGATLQNSIGMLQVGGFTDFEELLSVVRDECHAAVESYLTLQSVDVRRGRLIANAESFVHMLGAAIEALLNQMLADRKAALDASGLEEEEEIGELDDTFYPTSLPRSIFANKEPFKGGDWRKTPYFPRPYVRLTEYDIVEPSMRDIILRKLSTKKRGGCLGEHCKSREELGLYNVEREGFDTHCSCLARNTECDQWCACHGSDDCLNRAVSNRRALKLGLDADEVDSWGMDCYVRRNILDAILESGAFGPWTPPDYDALAAANPVEYAAMRAAASSTGGGAASPAAAALPPPPTARKQEVQEAEAGQMDEKPAQDDRAAPTTPAAAAESSSESSLDYNQAAAVAAALASPQPTLAQVAVEKRVADWLERVLLPAINRQGENGWDLLAAVSEVKHRAQGLEDTKSRQAAEAVEHRVKDVGYNYFRLHPKGVGLVCKRTGGLPPLTFVEEYLGEIHTPWRWFEIQDAVKKITGDELPDFYNIVLERPKDDPDGYDVLFIDAAAKGALASRMSHSCTPNCQAIVMACNGRLTIALYTLRHVYEGEELTFDYSSVTESEKEFRDAICLCSTRNCRGSYLYFTGSRAFQQVMNTKHTFLHRQAMIARAGSEPLTDDDWSRVKRHGLGDSTFGSVEHGDRVPNWLIKWTSLICEYIEEEEAHLKQDLLAHPLGIYNEATATAEAKGVVINRLQNVVITLDKVKMVLQAPNQPQGPCLRTLTDMEAVEHLWSGCRAVARRVLIGCVQAMAPNAVSGTFASAQTDQELQDAVQRHLEELPDCLAKMCGLVVQPAADFVDARGKLMQLYQQIRTFDLDNNGGLTAVADLLLLYASTQHWFTCERGYRGITSPPVLLNLADLSLDRTQVQTPAAAAAALAAASAAVTDSQHDSKSTNASMAEQSLSAGSKPGSTQDLDGAGCGSESDGQALTSNSNLRKVYRPLYIWGQLSGWFKQTVNDPTASLSAERRGTVSLPDVESSFTGGKTRYTVKDRNDLIDQLVKRPDAMWRTGTLWSFRNEAKMYGSPMLDAVWCEMSRGTGDHDPLPAVLAELRNAAVPQHLEVGMYKRGQGLRPPGKMRW